MCSFCLYRYRIARLLAICPADIHGQLATYQLTVQQLHLCILREPAPFCLCYSGGS